MGGGGLPGSSVVPVQVLLVWFFWGLLSCISVVLRGVSPWYCCAMCCLILLHRQSRWQLSHLCVQFEMVASRLAMSMALGSARNCFLVLSSFMMFSVMISAPSCFPACIRCQNGMSSPILWASYVVAYGRCMWRPVDLPHLHLLEVLLQAWLQPFF